MTDQQVQLFLADLAIIILLARLLGIAAKRLGQPPVLGEIIAGILLGPTLFHGKITTTLFPITLRAPLSALAWSLLAVVVAIAGAGSQQFRLLLVPVYAGVMFGLVRPLLRRLVDVYQRRGGLTPSILAAVLAGLLLSSYATGWMGLKYIFGAFLFGVVMPREGAAAALREEILDRLEQVSVLVLLPVFFVVSGLSVNLSSVGLSGLTELCLILLVAVVGKFGGAFIGASLARVRARRAGVLATLMNTRGLTGS